MNRVNTPSFHTYGDCSFSGVISAVLKQMLLSVQGLQRQERKNLLHKQTSKQRNPGVGLSMGVSLEMLVVQTYPDPSLIMKPKG